MLLNDKQITTLCGADNPMISPFIPIKLTEYIKTHQDGTIISKTKVPSYGLTSCGYDVRLNPNEFKIFNSSPQYRYIRLGNNYSEALVKFAPSSDGFVYIPANSYALGVTLERFNIPNNICGRCFGKSTLARVGIIVNVTPLEPGWSGYLTVEISNSCPIPVEIPINGGIAQVQFERIEEPKWNYGKGKYQNQGEEVTEAKL